MLPSQGTIMSTTVGKNPLEEVEQPSQSTEESEMQSEMQSQKWQNDLCSFLRKPFNLTVIQVCAIATNAEEVEVQPFCEDLQDLLGLTPKKKKNVLFIIGD